MDHGRKILKGGFKKMEKAKLTKQQAEKLELAKEYNLREMIVEQKTLGDIGNSLLYGTTLKEMPLDTLIRALYIGYEVEQTEQEKIQELWEFHIETQGFKAWHKQGMIDALKILGREDLIPEEEN
jgi:hypothetical protein